MLKDLKPNGFEDIVSVLALYRPGPMEFIPKYIAGKHGQIEVEYPHSDLKSILADTYGIIVYQEQIMQIASLMAGFSLGEADLLRRAVSKKKRETLDKERSHFVQGSLQQGYNEADANAVYDMIVRFADYGFPRAHAAAYGVLAFQTAYLKAHYPVQFMASMLTAVMGTHRKVAEYVLDCRRTGIGVLPPDVNESGVLFTPVPGEETGTGHIRFGLAAIKNVGTLAVENIMSVRKERPFDSLLDFCRRVDLRVCNKRVVESLLQAGAFDCLPGHRAQLLAMLDETVDAALKWRKERDELQIQLFDDLVETPNWEIRYPDIPKFTVGQQLEMERELLGLYLSGHPLDDSAELLEEPGIQRLMDLGEAADESQTVTAGMVVSVKEITTKQGKSMAFIEWEDQIERCEVVLFPEVWKRSRSLIAKGALLALRAKVQQEDEGFKLLAEEVALLSAETLRGLLQRRSAAASRSYSAGRSASAGTPPRGGAPASRASGAATGPAGRPAGGAAAPATPAPAAAPAPVSGQRVFIKITPAAENAAQLSRLKELLQNHPGPVATILFYERDQKLLALSDNYRIKPTQELFAAIESMLGAGTVRIK